MSKKIKENRDPSFENFNPDTFFSNQLSLPDAVKAKLNEQGLDWRFLNAAEFRKAGNTHRSHWRPFKAGAEFDGMGVGINAEGLIQRGDLVLGVREKRITAAHKTFLNQKNERLKSFNKEKAKELKKLFRDADMQDVSKVHEGYDEE